MNCSNRTPDFGIVRTCFMVPSQEGQIRVGVSSGPRGGHAVAGIDGV